MREDVSCKFTNAVLAFLDARGWSTESVVEGLGVPPAWLRDPDRWISYETVRRFEDRVDALLREPEVWKAIGFHAATSWSFGFLDVLARLLGRPDYIYRALPVHNRFMTRVSDLRWCAISSGHGVLEVRARPGYEWSPYVFDFIQGLLAGLPTYWGLPAARVEPRPAADAPADGSPPRAVRFEVRWEGRKPWHRRLWDYWFGQRRLLRESTRQLRAKAFELERRNQEIRALNATLEARVRERAEAAERTAKELEKALRDRDALLRAVTHDLGAPLRNIAGFADALARENAAGLDDRGRDRLDRIRRNAERMSGMLESLLDLSRIKERGARKRPVDLAAVVRDVEERLSFELRARGVRVEIEGTLPTIACEPGRVAQVFQNLIDNACKYASGVDAPVVRVGARDAGTHWEVWVRDNGPGIPTRDLPAVFDLFRRGREAAATVEGKGVGLATVKTIAESYGGTAWAVSEPGRGAAFHFTLDKDAVRDDEASEPAASAA